MSKQVHAQLFLCINRPKIYGKSMEMLLKSINVYGKLREMLVKSINVYDEEKKTALHWATQRRQRCVEFKLGWHAAPMTSATFATLVSELVMFQHDSLFWFQNRMKANTIM